MKKIYMLIPVFAIALVASSAFAWNRPGSDDGCCDKRSRDKECCPSLTITNDNHAVVKTKSEAKANTGMNKSFFSVTKTGEAWAESYAGSNVNDNYIEAEAPDKGSVTITNKNGAYVFTDSKAKANTGKNHSAFSFTSTGKAGAYSEGTSIVNTNVIKVED